MTSTIHIDIVSAEKAIYSGEAELVVATGLMGEVGIVYGHAPLLTQLKPGEVRVTTTDGKEDVFYISGGMLEVQPGSATILADEAERAESLDEAKAIKAKEKAETAIANRDSDFDYTLASADLARAAAQIQAIRKIRKR
tara:strand:+ start:129 stop:545 length:417 start_codon:yes stop_codon:yes gene_type:complete